MLVYRDVSRQYYFSGVAIDLFRSPLDFIPDFIPMLGFADDLALLTFVISKLKRVGKISTLGVLKDLNN
jgi:uncharacterized membrane protein YkvA (DUF1232 family)